MGCVASVPGTKEDIQAQAKASSHRKDLDGPKTRLGASTDGLDLPAKLLSAPAGVSLSNETSDLSSSYQIRAVGGSLQA